MTDSPNDTLATADAMYRAREVVANWFLTIWLTRPKWLNRMPDDVETSDLVNGIAAVLNRKSPVTDPTPAMIDAGMEVVWCTDIMEPREAELRVMVADVFKAMHATQTSG